MSTSILIPGSGKGAPAMQAAVKGRSLWDDARRRLFRNRAAVASMIVLGLLVAAAIVGPHLTAYRYDEINKDDVWLGPLQNGHLIGTDSLGRDLLARLLMGLRGFAGHRPDRDLRLPGDRGWPGARWRASRAAGWTN